MELIDKAVIVAKIEKQLSATDTLIAVLEGNKVILTKLLSFLDTLEVYDVELK